MRQLWITRGKRRTHPYIRSAQVEWEPLAEKLLKFKRTGETFAEYMAMPVAEQADIKDVGYLVGGQFIGKTRKKDELANRSLVTLDVDHCDDPQKLLDSYSGFELVMHSTHKHQDSAPRLRLVFPLSRDVSPFEYEAVARNLAAWHGMDDFDDTTFEVSRIMYWPSASSDGEIVAVHQQGDWVNPDDWEPQQDLIDWPRSSRVTTLRDTTGVKARDPLIAPGIIGAFNRTYDIHAAIAEFLPGVFEIGESDNRYRAVGSSGEAGAIVYDDVFMYSHHESLPDIFQRNLNAFDLVPSPSASPRASFPSQTSLTISSQKPSLSESPKLSSPTQRSSLSQDPSPSLSSAASKGQTSQASGAASG